MLALGLALLATMPTVSGIRPMGTIAKIPPSKAAESNKTLVASLKWTFGSKEQTGWKVYVPLMQRMLKTQADPETVEFVQAVSRWQNQQGIPPTGILDETTLMEMVKTWQGERPVKNPTEAMPDALVSIDRAALYDITREAQLCFVERETYMAYQDMVAAALKDPSLGLKKNSTGGLAADEPFLKIISAFRSQAYQDQLRRQSPDVGRAGLAKVSPHLTGQALDIYVGGEPVTTKDENRLLQIQTPVYRWLVQHAAEFGFYPYFYEPWHWEYRRKNSL
ncbi:MAG: D-alanyl-D-alanine carboxypeptidase family protein [Blastocatellia bacterium]|nr:D-alanyl-D-alanine carboxypeptidase family protein [Blastocatellia bacterium]